MIIFNLIFSLFVILYHNKIILVYKNFLKKKKIKNISKKPTLGGFFIFINLILYFFLFKNPLQNFFLLEFDKYLFLICILIIFLVGAYDDLVTLTPFQRTIIISITLFFFLSTIDFYQIKILQAETFGLDIDITRISVLFTVICFVVIINSINMFDGLNGQSGLYFFQVFSYIYLSNNSTLLIILLISIVAFLVLNLFNKIYFGDSGIYLLSFLLGLTFINGYHNSYLSVEEIFLLSSVPLYDLIRLFFYRIFMSNSPFSGDRQHIHHICTIKYGYFFALIIIQIYISLILMLSIFSSFIIAFLFSIIFYFLLVSTKKKLPKNLRNFNSSIFN
jgi:UDP-GlcNAc:undecaprenyl-phosphate/decaprenyl-phosphate GlcNAc-1-phosphate transferase